MKKSTIILLVLNICFSGFGQFIDVLEDIEVGLYPGDYSSGTIKRHKLTSDNIETFPGLITVGDILNYRYVAWADFDISQIPKGVKVDIANIYFNVIEESSSANHLLYIVKNPYTISQSSSNSYKEEMYNFYRNTFGYESYEIYSNGSGLCRTVGSCGISMTANGVRKLELELNSSSANKFKTTFIEYELNNSAAIIDGGTNNKPPTLYVEYYLSNLKMIHGLALSSKIYGGSIINVKATVENNTRSRSEEMRISYQLHESQGSTNAIWADGKKISPLESGGVVDTEQGTITIPNVSQARYYYIKYELDWTNSVKEADETDNVYWEKIAVYPTAPTVSSITISGTNSVEENSSANYTCTAIYSDGSSQNVTNSASWSENSSYATISSNGILSAISVNSDQNCTITASYGGNSDNHYVTIKNVAATVTSVTISGSTSVNENSSANYTCTAIYSDGSSQNVTNSASWSENSSYATISSNGVLSSNSVSSNQTCIISASYGGKSDTHSVTIRNVEDPAPTCEDIYEPNDEIENPNTTAFNTNLSSSYNKSISGTIHEAGDWDHYRINIVNNGTLKLTLSNVPDGFDLQLFDYDHDYVTGSFTNGNEDIDVSITNTGYYYIIVGSLEREYSCTPYNLDVSWSPVNTTCEDTYEPNDEIENPNTTAFNTNLSSSYNKSITGTIHESGDWDHYRINVVNSGALKLTLRNVPDGFDLQLFDYDHDYVTGSFTNGNEDIDVSITNTGYYYIIVGSLEREYSCNPYNLDVSWSPENSITHSAPTLNSPANNATIEDQATFSWEHTQSTDFNRYRLQFNAGAYNINDGSKSKFVDIDDIGEGDNTWCVYAYYDDGTYEKSEIRNVSFQKTSQIPRFTNLSDGELFSVSKLVTWEHHQNENFDYYGLHASAVINGRTKNLWYKIDDGSKEKEILVYHMGLGNYQLQIRAYYNGESVKSSDWINVTSVPVGTPPLSPTIIEPADNADIMMEDFFRWELTTDPDGDDLEYEEWISFPGRLDLQFEGRPASIQGTKDKTQSRLLDYDYNFSDFWFDTKLEWCVLVTDGEHVVRSEVREIKLIKKEFEAITPFDKENDITIAPTLEWTFPETTANIYNLWWKDDDGSYQNILDSNGIVSCDIVDYISQDLEYSKEYKWQVTIGDNKPFEENDFSFTTMQNPTAIDENNNFETNIKVYPNPCNELFFVECENSNEEVLVSIYSPVGKVIHIQKIPAGIGLIEISTQNLSTGVYFVQAKHSKGITVKKLVVN